MRGLVLAATFAAALVIGTGVAAQPRLVGTLLSPGGDRAVFEDASGRQVARRVGDEVAAGWRLRAVRRNVVELRDASGRTVTVRAGAAPRAPEPAGDGAEPSAMAPPPVSTRPGNEAVDPPLQVRHGSRLAHARHGGRFEGLALVGGPPHTPLLRAGLLPGDLIVAVDGRDLDGEDARLVPSVLEALDDADEAAPVLVEARRGDEVIRVSVGAR